MENGLKQEILETLGEIIAELDSIDGAAALSFGKLIVNISASAGAAAQSVWDIPDAQFLEAARSMLAQLRVRKRTGPRRMWIRSVDQHGYQLAEDRLVTVPAPEQVPEDGLDHLGEYVCLLFGSESAFCSLIVFTLDQQRGLSIWRRGGGATLSVHVDWRQDPEREQAIRQFFSGRGLTPDQDYLAGNGDIRDATRILSYLGGDSAEHTTDLCGSFLREVYRVTETEGLTFLFQENLQDVLPGDPTD